MRQLFGAMIAGLVLAQTVRAEAPRPLVETTEGPVLGIERDGVRVFNGIPFAAAPVGALRFAPPAPRALWTVPIDGAADAPACPQTGHTAIGKPSSNEDCLALNVTTPAAENAGPRAVMVWIHGNGNDGYGGAANFNPARLVREQGVIAVTINYRLGPIGSMVLPRFDRQHHLSGHQQLRDQQAALRWVQRNIARFGGDPRRVTVAGCSWGGSAVLTLLASPASRGLFARAIVESEGGALAQTRAEAERMARERFLPKLGCAENGGLATCLEAAPASAFAALDEPLPRPMDPRLLPQDPLTAFAQGRFVRVPVLIGSNREEGHFFVHFGEDQRHRPVNADDYRDDITAWVGDILPVPQPWIIAHYPADAFASPGFAESRAITDIAIACPTAAVRRGLARHVPVYGYEFAEPDPAQQEPLPAGTEMPNASYHTTEETYVFDTDAARAPLTGRAAELGRMVRDYWGAFIRDGDPNAGAAGSRPVWPRFDPKGTLLVLRHEPGTDTGFERDHHCEIVWHDFPDQAPRSVARRPSVEPGGRDSP